MEVLLLGTGAADGWPSPLCACTSCADARRRGDARGPTAALLDGRILLDAGPGVPTALARAGTSLADVHHVIVTHAHYDHLHPALLLNAAWTPLPHRLHVWGPPGAIAECRHWISPAAAIDLHEIAPGVRAALSTPEGDWEVIAHAAAHDVPDGADPLAAEALLLEVRDPLGTRLLYATDTGPLPAATVAALTAEADARGPLDLLLVEETFGDVADHGTGHLDLATLPVELDRLRRAGVVAAGTRIAAIHLGHHNPPVADLARRLAAWSVHLPADLERIEIGADASTQSGGAAPGAARPPATLIVGGVRSGKSAIAEALLRDHPRVAYVATAAPPDHGTGDAGNADDTDDAWTQRIEAHRSRRPPHWTTRETADLAGAIGSTDADCALLVDSLTTWLDRVLGERAPGGWDALPPATITAWAAQAADGLVDALARRRCRIVIVSDEIGFGGVAAAPAARHFADALGLLNQRIAAACDETLLVVAGRTLRLDPAEPTARTTVR